MVAEPAWSGLAQDRVDAARERLGEALAPFVHMRSPNEAETERQIIYPALEILGWHDILPQQNQSAAGRKDVPDALLFIDNEMLSRARTKQQWQRYQHGACILESKRWAIPLDRPADARDKRDGEEGIPSSQILHYLRRAEDVTRGALRWGILTNGRLWRLYWQGALSPAEDFLEIDLGKICALPGCAPDLLDPPNLTSDHALRLFLLAFGRNGFVPGAQGRTFHAIALEQGKRWEEKLARDLSRIVFTTVFPMLAGALARHDRGRPETPTTAWLEDIRKGTLILLYRLLFVLYAEDRDLLPNKSGPYAAYALSALRIEIAEARAKGRRVSGRQTVYWARLKAIFDTIGRGDDTLGVPPYNGGLFDTDSAPILSRVALPDSIISDVIFALSHVEDEHQPKYVNYRDLSVQQLGSVYERILEFGVRANEKGDVVIDREDGERHDTGSYYTPDALVSLIIGRTIAPLLKARTDAFEQAADTLRGDRGPIADRLAKLETLDPASAYLDLKICDPAMGSGHFLVSLVDWLATRVLEALAEAPTKVTWANYTSPLLSRVATMRNRILGEARTHGWTVAPEQLDDRRVLRRMILKRVVFGVDKNPFAVELAKVALWLHTFTVGAPLSFLDHHLRCGDSIVGAWIRPTLDVVAQGGGLLFGAEVARVENIAARMTEIEEMTDNDIAEVHASATVFGAIADATRQLDAFLSLMTARHMLDVNLSPHLRQPRDTPGQLRRSGAGARQIATAEKQAGLYNRAAAFKAILARQYGDPLQIATGEIVIDLPPEDEDTLLPGDIAEREQRRRRAAALVIEARAVAKREHFLHWPVAFPNVWQHLTDPEPAGGFDAIISNPPYVRQEKLAAIKPALEASYKTYAGTADLYLYFFEQGLRLVKPGGRVGYVVTNKWLKAGYAEELRAMLTDPERAETDIVIDFGHARAFFPDADVFPNVVILRRPDESPVAEKLTISVPHRDTLPDESLPETVAGATFALARSSLTRNSWTLEPDPVTDLLLKVRQNGFPLTEYAGTKPTRGILTGLNEAFLIDTPTRNKLVAVDPGCAKIIKPYLRGQDIHRWSAPHGDRHIIVLKSSNDYDWAWSDQSDEISAEKKFAEAFPALHAHMKRFENMPSENGNEPKGLRRRQDKGRFWWELRSCAYYETFDAPKILYVDICWTTSFMLDLAGRYVSNSSYFLPTADPWLVAVLNAPIGWWYSWRLAQKGKDDALRYFTSFVEAYPVPPAPNGQDIRAQIDELARHASQTVETSAMIHDWLRLEFGIERPGRALENPHTLDAIRFANEVRAALPRRRTLSVAEIARLKHEHTQTIEPARRAAAGAARLERRLSDLVNAAYGLTPEETKLMWETAPPRMPIPPPASAARQ